MNNYNPNQKNPPWVRSSKFLSFSYVWLFGNCSPVLLLTAVHQQPLLAQQMTVQSVALSQPLTTTTHLAQNQLGQVQITPTIQGQVQLPITQAHLSLNQQLTPTFGQVQINQAQLANIATIHQHHQGQTQTYFAPSISLQQVRLCRTIIYEVDALTLTLILTECWSSSRNNSDSASKKFPLCVFEVVLNTFFLQSSVVIPTSITTPMTSIAPPGLAIPTSLATVQVFKNVKQLFVALTNFFPSLELRYI